jgi:hypothetical protein
MRCHKHLDRDAVAICVSCGSGLCRNCQVLTRDQRNLCDLPQCAGFEKRQMALLEAMEQGCAHRAAAFQMFRGLLRRICLAILLPALIFVFADLIIMALYPGSVRIARWAIALELLLMVFIPVATIWRFQSNMQWLQNMWQDLAGMFRRHTESPAGGLSSEKAGSQTPESSDHNSPTVGDR